MRVCTFALLMSLIACTGEDSPDDGLSPDTSATPSDAGAGPVGPLPLIPGAQGDGGLFSRAAYGCGVDPEIIKVTNLENTGPGSLREALLAPVPRVIVFEVSGTITLHPA